MFKRPPADDGPGAAEARRHARYAPGPEEPLPPALLQRLRHLIAARTGLHLRERDLPRLRRAVESRHARRRLPLEEYVDRLASPATEEGGEWERLIPLLTVGESFFFRDRGQFALLRERLLPELIERQRETRSLRVWSAGCAAGEEPYSLAILLDELLGSAPDWNVVILGTDLNPRAVEAAQRGLYGDWSLRALDPLTRARYFTRRGERWELSETIRRRVSFAVVNLVQGSFPSATSPLHDLDLVLCRNVFIYFEREMVARVADKLASALREGGYLLTGHAEMFGLSLGALQQRVYPESLVYQRSPSGAIETPPPARYPAVPPLWPLPAPPGPVTTRPPLPLVPALPAPATGGVPPRTAPGPARSGTGELADEAEALLADGAHGAAIRCAEEALQARPRDPRALRVLAQAHADRGEYEQALSYCQRGRDADALLPWPYSLLARIAEERGNREEARTLLRKVLYLSPGDIYAHLELGDLYEAEGDGERARSARAAALRYLRELPPDALVEGAGGASAGALVESLSGLLGGEA